MALKSLIACGQSTAAEDFADMKTIEKTRIQEKFMASDYLASRASLEP